MEIFVNVLTIMFFGYLIFLVIGLISLILPDFNTISNFFSRHSVREQYKEFQEFADKPIVIRRNRNGREISQKFSVDAIETYTFDEFYSNYVRASIHSSHQFLIQDNRLIKCYEPDNKTLWFIGCKFKTKRDYKRYIKWCDSKSYILEKNILMYNWLNSILVFPEEKEKVKVPSPKPKKMTFAECGIEVPVQDYEKDILSPA